VNEQVENIFVCKEKDTIKGAYNQDEEFLIPRSGKEARDYKVENLQNNKNITARLKKTIFCIEDGVPVRTGKGAEVAVNEQVENIVVRKEEDTIKGAYNQDGEFMIHRSGKEASIKNHK